MALGWWLPCIPWLYLATKGGRTPLAHWDVERRRRFGRKYRLELIVRTLLILILASEIWLSLVGRLSRKCNLCAENMA